MRIALFEFEDLEWFPNSIREGMTDYLRYLLNTLNFYEPVTPLIAEGLSKTNSNQIIDLCSGAGGAMESIQSNLKQTCKEQIKITLTDKFPNLTAFNYLKEKRKGSIDYVANSVDATNVASDLKGFRTIFSGFHHFNPPLAKKIMSEAVNAKAGIGIFDGGDKNIFTLFGIILFHPIGFLLFTPFFRPFKISSIFFTYLIPVIPICTIWDGIVSILRLYEPKELLQMAKEAGDKNYIWKAGKVKNKFGMKVTYLIGYPG